MVIRAQLGSSNCWPMRSVNEVKRLDPALAVADVR